MHLEIGDEAVEALVRCYVWVGVSADLPLGTISGCAAEDTVPAPAGRLRPGGRGSAADGGRPVRQVPR
jgi:hypothetical protein